jgi:hypothetical protein
LPIRKVRELDIKGFTAETAKNAESQSRWKVLNQSFEPVHKTSYIKVKQQPEVELGKFKIGQDLGIVDTIEQFVL